jgi:hypothetical protein
MPGNAFAVLMTETGQGLLSVLREGKVFHCAIGKRWNGSAESKNLSMRRNFNRENREIPEISASASNHAIVERSENASGGTADMVVSGKSDDFVVPTKLASKTGTPAAESMKGRRSPKSSCVSFAIAPDAIAPDAIAPDAIAPDTVPDHAVRATGHARHVAMDSSLPSSLNRGAV